MGIGRIIACFLLCLTLWLTGLIWFIGQIPTQPAINPPQADAIVALTGGSGRLEYSLQLLTQGKGQELFISGVGEDITIEQLLRQVPLHSTLTPEQLQHIALGHKAENTIGNAMETTRWLRQHGYHTILLVTSNYHMPRSLEEFTEAAPGMTIIPVPVFPGDFTLSDWWNDAASRTIMLSEYHKLIASKLRHWFFPLGGQHS
jgi:uncharacterized SAM-binding protein YcdF (DUF218 family)